MRQWLKDKGVQYDEKMYKPQLYKLVLAHKQQNKNYSIDRILAEHNHSVVRLPPYHPDLNPIEMAWAAIKGYVSSKNVNWNITKVIDLVKEKVASMGPIEWEKLCHKVKDIEQEYIKNDHVIDLVTDEFVIYADDESDSDEGSDSDSDDEDNDSQDTQTSSNSLEPRPSTSAGTNLMEGISFLEEDWIPQTWHF